MKIKIKKLLSSKLLIAVVIIVVISVFVLSHRSKNGEYKTYEVALGDFVNITEVSGKVVPGQEIDLGFEVGGKIQSINVEAGDEVKRGTVLARLDSSEINSEINEAIADLRTEETKLNEISGSEQGQNKIASIKNSLINTLKKTYISSDGVVKNIIDTFIEDPQSRSPEFDVSLGDYFLRKEIEEKRVSVGLMLNNWISESANYSVESISLIDAEESISNLRQIESLLYSISLGTDDFSPTTNKTQSQIDAYISSINSARTTIAGLIVDINSATEALRDVQADVPILQASVNSANATVQKLSVKSNNYVIVAPFDGIVTESDFENGGIVTSGESVISMVSNNAFEVESFIPEVSIAGIEVGDNAEMVFDAFGPDQVLEAFISHIDPRETIKDGITTYGITLDFKELNTRVLSGMNVEIKIIKEKIENQLVIPRYLVQTDENGKFVEKFINGDRGEKIRVDVTLGQRDSNGNVIIESGVSEGDKIVIPE
jgi:HlyD family secretion protein